MIQIESPTGKSKNGETAKTNSADPKRNAREDRVGLFIACSENHFPSEKSEKQNQLKNECMEREHNR